MACNDSTCSLEKLRGIPPNRNAQGILPQVTYLQRPQAPPPPDNRGMTFYNRREMYIGIVDYYGDLTMGKIQSTNPSFSMYACRISCLCNQNRYLFAITHPDLNPVGMVINLSRLSWVSFQARVSPEIYRVPEHAYQPSPSAISRVNIHQTEEKVNGVVYKVEGHPLKLELIGKEYFSQTGTIGDALEMFCSVLWFDG